MEKIKLQLESEEQTERPLRPYLIMKMMQSFSWLAGGGIVFDLSITDRKLLVAVEGWGAVGLCHALPVCVWTVFNIHLSVL